VTALSIVILGLSITSSWGNGHATTYRSLARALTKRDHDVLFLERDVPWYADNRDFTQKKALGRIALYRSLEQLKDSYTAAIRKADLVIVGSYVPDGVAVGKWVLREARGATAFYDIDTPVTLAKLQRGDFEYLSPDLIPRWDLYLSFTGGPLLRRLEQAHGAKAARALYCSVDDDAYFPEETPCRWDLGYMGTYSDDRQPKVETLLCSPARAWRKGRFVVAGPQYPADIVWPRNVERIEHLPPGEHRGFYNAQRWTLNVTRAAMVRTGWSPSVRLFEAAACGVPIISDPWPGLDTIFTPGEEIVVARSAEECTRIISKVSDRERRRIGERARARILAEHTALRRAAELETYATEALERRKAA
jgi:spore maturation protein CgeB